jgi:methylmalonyl-CoA epimerase/tRNA threonylcarbamoyl adenosine modification protein YeaZ
MNFSLDHLGIAVKSLESAKGFYKLLGLPLGDEEEVPAEKVKVAMVPVGDTRIELLEPTSEDSVVAKFISKRGEGLHHISLRVPDLESAVAELKRNGVRLVSEDIGVGAGGHRYIFVHPSSAGGVLLELVESSLSMLILGVDTSGKNGSIALVRFEGETSRTLDVVPLEGGTFSAQLVPQISALLTKHKLNKRDIDAFAVASGPGSFTGLRVGLAAIKALAEILDKPIAAVSLLEITARVQQTVGTVIAALDASRGEVFAGTYNFEKHTAIEELLTIPELQARAVKTQVVTSDQRLAEALKHTNVDVSIIPPPRADCVARLGFEKLRRGETVSPEALDATYIRRSDAEIMRTKRVPK